MYPSLYWFSICTNSVSKLKCRMLAFKICDKSLISFARFFTPFFEKYNYSFAGEEHCKVKHFFSIFHWIQNFPALESYKLNKSYRVQRTVAPDAHLDPVDRPRLPHGRWVQPTPPVASCRWRRSGLRCNFWPGLGSPVSIVCVPLTRAVSLLSATVL